jgi:uncharacterized protein (DUF1501 family)
MQRRQLLQKIGLTTLGMMLPLSHQTWVARAAGNPTGKRMIVIFLRGAVDGLSVLVPYNEPTYYSVRPNIALGKPGSPQGVYDLDGNFGLNPALAAVMPLWSAGKLGFVVASGSPDRTRSHFDAQDYMESGTPGVKSTADGWMNRLLGNIRTANPIQALNVGKTTPRILQGKQAIAAIAPGKQASQKLATDRDDVAKAFEQLYGSNNRLGKTYRDGQAARSALLENLKQEQQQADNGAPAAAGFPTDARRLARLMVQDQRIELGFMAIGGWDTHFNQGNAQGQLANNLRLLGQGVSILAQELGNVFQDTVIVVMSEFGRTVKENGTKGTDHGRGNVMWVAGGGVRGQKIYGDWPGLDVAGLEDGRDVPVTTDFRAVLSPILSQHWRLSDAQLAAVLPNYSGESAIDLLVNR